MDKYVETIEERLFVLKKRLREEEMREIFETRFKSIIEVAERIKTKKKQRESNQQNRYFYHIALVNYPTVVIVYP